ncbi:MAG TPA: AAA family ATPase [Fimbriimonadaceae bacterium]|nr:AAA family ATPase [Fimbriimonadaceae bacterium]
MIRKITLENFMSHSKTVIEPAEGLTVLTGPNNCGKSAVVVALQALCTNERSSKTFVRHGAREARVTVETAEGHRIEWVRGKEASYRIDGRDVHRLRGQLPDGLHQALRLPMVVDPQGTEFDIHFAEQKSPIFLLNEPGSRAATFFASSSDARLLMMMQQRHKEKVKEKRTEERLLLQEQGESKRALDSIGDLESLEAQVADAVKKHESLTRSIRAAEDLYRAKERLSILETRLADVEAQSRTLSALAHPPLQEDTDRGAELCRFLGALENARVRYSALCNSLESLLPPPPVEDAAPIARLVKMYSQVTRASGVQSALHACCGSLDAPPTLLDTSHVAQTILSLKALERRCSVLARKLSVADGLPAPPALEVPDGLKHVIHRLAQQRELVGRQGAELRAIEAERRAVEELAERFVEKHPSCPTCGSRLQPGSVLGREVHVHA